MREANAQDRHRATASSSRCEPQGHAADRAGRGRGGDRGQGRPRLHGRARDPADDRARRFQGHQARAADRRGRRRRDRRGARRASPSRTGRSPPRREGAKAENGDRVTIDFIGTIDGEPFEGGTGDDIAVELGSSTFIPGFEEQLIGVKAGREAHRQGDVPGRTTCDARARRQGRRVRRDGEGGRGAGRGRRSTTSSPSSSAWNRSPSCKRRGQGAHRARARRRSRAARSSAQLLDELDEQPQVRAAADAWSSRSSTNVWQTGRERPEAAGPHLRGRGHDRGGGARPSTARSPSGACGSAWCSPRSARRTRSRSPTRRCTRAVVERARQFPGQEQQVWEYYRKNPQALAEPARAALRGEGRRLPARARQGDRQDGLARGALQAGRRGRAGREARLPEQAAVNPCRRAKCQIGGESAKPLAPLFSCGAASLDECRSGASPDREPAQVNRCEIRSEPT